MLLHRPLLLSPYCWIYGSLLFGASMAYIGHSAETADWSKIWPENLRKEKGEKKIYFFFYIKEGKRKKKRAHKPEVLYVTLLSVEELFSKETLSLSLFLYSFFLLSSLSSSSYCLVAYRLFCCWTSASAVQLIL